MPTKKSKHDTWKESELLDAIQGSDRSKKKSSSSRSREKESSGPSGHRSKGESKEKDRERGERKDRDGDKRREDADSRHRRDAEHNDRERKRDRDRDREKDRDKESRRDKDSHRDREGRRDKDSSRDKERERRRHREDESRDTNDTSERRRTERDKRERDRTEKDRAEKDDDRKRRRDKHGERSEGKSREARHDEGREREKDRTEGKRHERNGERRREKDGSSRDKLTEKIRDYDSREGRHDSAESQRRESKSSKSKSKDKSDRHRSRKTEDYDFDDRIEQRDSEKETDKDTRHRSEKSKSRKLRSKHSDDVVETQILKESSNNDENPSQETLRYKPEKKISKQESYEEDIEEETTKRPSLALRKESILNTEEVNEEVIATGYDYDYGDDDFEDYDDDFEDDEGDDDASGFKEDELNLTNEELEGVDEIRKAIREENELAKSLNSSASSSRPSTRDGVQGSSATTAVKNQARGKINFIAAKQKQISDKVSSRTRRRGKELSTLIELDMVAMDLFELQPLNIYEVYMKSFGRTGTEQVAVQTNDDNLEQETQTDDIETETRWCQFSNEVQAFGGGDEKTQQSITEKKSFMTQDTRRLNKFLGRAAQLCLTLLDEVNGKLERTSNKYKDSRSTFSDSFARVDVKHKVTKGRNFVDAQLSPTQSNLLLVAYGSKKDLKNNIAPDGLLCVWNINENDEPRKYLSCGSTPRCCCFSPTKPSFAFAGMDDGSVSVWDLREPPSMHSRRSIDGFEFILRSETFSTASVYGEENHISSVVSLVSIAPLEDSDSSNRDSRDTIGKQRKAKKGRRSHDKDTDNGGRALQLASLEENGTVNIWVVIEVFSPDPGGSVQDLGLLPGGKVKLVKSGSISPQMPIRSPSLPQSGNYSATRLHVEPKDAQYLYIGTDQGEVLHCSRFGEKVIPKSFCTCDPDSPVMVSSIDHSPFRMPYVLVGCSDGSILLFDSNKEFPVTTWQMFSRGAGIVAARWSYNKPSVFYVLDRHSFFYVWDLFKSNTGPIFKESMAKGEARPTNFFLSNDSAGNQEVVFFNNDNSLEVHKLKKLLVDSSKDDIESLCAQIEELS